jgi:phenylacetate-CoA ligase
MTNFSIIKDLYLTARGVLTFHFFLKKSQYWGDKRLKHYQFEKLKKLLVEANENIDYYKELFKEIGFVPQRDFKKLTDLEKIPILTKKAAIENRERLINKRYIKDSLILRTSGSTGTPFEVLVSPSAWIFEQGVVWRHWSWGGYRFRDSLGIVRSFAPKAGEKLIKTDRIRNFTFYSPFHLNRENIKIYLKDMVDRKVNVLRGYPSSILTLAEYILDNEVRIPKLKMLLTASEVLNEGERKKIKKAFGAKIYNHYGLAEVCVMMGSCECEEGMHNYEEYGYCELIDNEFGQKKIIGTNLHNLAMPLIRYDTGDISESDWGTCSCGRGLPIIKNILGRKDSNILTPEGYKIPTVNFYTMFEKFTDISSWQIVQRSLFEIDFIINSRSISDLSVSMLKNDISQRIPDSINYRILLNGEFVKFAEGKKNAFVSLIK